MHITKRRMHAFIESMGEVVDVRPPVFHMLYNSTTHYKHSTVTIDCMYRENPLCAASYLLWSRHKDMESTMRAAIIDNNTSKSLPLIDAEFTNKLKNAGLGYEHVKYIIITHVHLDHAGATGHLLKKCPNAIVLCHPKAVRHLIEPSRLIQAAKDIYGESRFAELYGEVLPCEEDRVQAVKNNETVDLTEGRSLKFFHVDGHAKHHLIALDIATESVFAGDAYGIRYPWLPLFNVMEPLVFPSSSPPDFNADEQRDAIKKIISFDPRKVYITHYGMIEDVMETSNQLLKNLDSFENVQEKLSKMLAKGRSEDEVLKIAQEEIKQFFIDELEKRGLANDSNEFWNFFNHDVNINSQGLFVAAKKNSIRSRQKYLDVIAKEDREQKSATTLPKVLSCTEPPGRNPSAAQEENKRSYLTVSELQETFFQMGLEPYCTTLEKQEIDGEIFIALTKGDIAAVFPNLPFGARFRMEKLQKKLQQLTK